MSKKITITKEEFEKVAHEIIGEFAKEDAKSQKEAQRMAGKEKGDLQSMLLGMLTLSCCGRTLQLVSEKLFKEEKGE